MKIEVCSKICKECGFLQGNQNTLYAELYEILQQGKVFPCHMYLKSKTGSENTGSETLDTVKVCRGYVTFVAKHGKHLVTKYEPEIQNIWINTLIPKITKDDLGLVYDMYELINNHKGLSFNTYLNNKINIG